MDWWRKDWIILAKSNPFVMRLKACWMSACHCARRQLVYPVAGWSEDTIKRICSSMQRVTGRYILIHLSESYPVDQYPTLLIMRID